MEWSFDALYGKAKLYARRAYREDINSALFGFWMSLSLELLARAALAHIHPALLADPKEPDNILYVFGVIPKGNPKSVQAKAVFARCSILISDFTDKMSGHCLILADRRNAELHSGLAAFESVDNSNWLPATHEVMDVLLRHVGRGFDDLLEVGDARGVEASLADRRDTIIREVQEKLAAARKVFAGKSEQWKVERQVKASPSLEAWIAKSALRRKCNCPSCNLEAGMSGENVGNSPIRIDEAEGVIKREVRILPNLLLCPYCSLKLSGFQEMKEAGRGTIYTIEEIEDPIEFFGIVPEEYVDVDDLIRNHFVEDYENE